MFLRRLVIIAALAAVPMLVTAQEVVSREPAGDPLAGGPCRFVPASGRTLSDTYDRYWATDLDLTNLGDGDATVRIALLARGENNRTAPVAVLAPIPPGASVHLDDVVPLVLERQWRTFLGGISVCAGGAPVLAVSRTAWRTPVGTVGQSMPALTSAQALPAGTTAHLLGLREDAAVRTNVGVLNPSSEPVSVRLRLFDDSGALVITLLQDVPAVSQIQINRALARFGLSSGRIEVDCEDGPLFPYATRVDNLTNDSAWIAPQIVVDAKN